MQELPNEKFKKKRYIISLAITVIGMLSLFTGTSYAILKGTTTSTNTQIIKAGSVELRLTENFNNINSGISTMRDADALIDSNIYEFNVKNIGTVAAQYDLKLVNELPSGATGTLIDDEYVKIGLEVNNKEMGPMNLDSVNSIIDTNTINENEVIHYKMRIWFDNNRKDEIEAITNGKVYLKLKLEAKQSDYKESEKALITFDPNGGTIPAGDDWTGSGSTATKNLVPGTNYGDLPTPTRSGYTFKGWNGKNLAYLTNDSNLIGTNHATDTNIDINTGTLSGTNNLSGNNFIGAAVSNLEINEAYYVSWSNKTNIFGMYAYDDRLWGNNLFYNSNPFLFTATTEKIIIGFYVAPQKVGTITNFQVEKGTEATEYEPYYITSSTKVVQTANHTLKAIWESNS